MPSSDEESISRWSRYVGYREVILPKRSFSIDVDFMKNTTHANDGQEQPDPKPKQPKHALRRKKSRIFNKGVLGVLRRISGNKSASSSSDPEDAPNRPHIVPPLHDSSDPERSSLQYPNDVENSSPAVGTFSRAVGSAFKRDTGLVDPGCALTKEEKILEITELVRVRTASSGITLQRPAELDGKLDGQERQGVLEIARTAANVASREYSRARRTRPKTVARALERDVEVPFSGVNDYREYLRCLQRQAKELHDGFGGLEVFHEAFYGMKLVRRSFDGMSDLAERGNAEADMMEIRWLVERKCMFWAAVDILTADDTQLGQVEVTDY